MDLGKTFRNLFLAGVLAVSPYSIKKADAIPITIGLEARVSSMDDQNNLFSDKIKVGDIINGYYTFDSDISDSNPSSPSVGDYWFTGITPYGISLNAGGFIFKTNPNDVRFLIEICDNHPWFDPKINNDSYLLRSYNNLPLANGVGVEHIAWQLDNYSGTGLNSDALPLTAPVLSDWPDTQAGLTLDGGRKAAYFIRLEVTSATVIPEPSTVALLGLGSLALFGKGKKK